MKILVDARPMVDRLQGGVTRVANGIFPALFHAMPHDEFVLITTGMRKPPIPLSRHVHLSLPNKIWSSLCILGLTSLDHIVQKEHPDLLFLSNIGFVGKPVIPYALLVHDLSFLIEPRWYSWKGRLWHKAVRAISLIKEAKILFAVSEGTKKDLINLLDIPAERITVIPIGLDPATSESEGPIILNHNPYVVALGGDNVRKNASCAIQAVHDLRLNPAYKDLLLVLFGTSARHHYPSFVIGFGHPNDRARDTILRHAKAFLYPSWYEGFGLPLHEAARFHVPCISSTAGALPETAPTGTLFAPPSKPHLWTQALKMILEQPDACATQTELSNWQKAAEIIRDTIKK